MPVSTEVRPSLLLEAEAMMDGGSAQVSVNRQDADVALGEHAG